MKKTNFSSWTSFLESQNFFSYLMSLNRVKNIENNVDSSNNIVTTVNESQPSKAFHFVMILVYPSNVFCL